MPMTPKDMIRLLKKNGFVYIKSNNASHQKYRNVEKNITVSCACKRIEEGHRAAAFEGSGAEKTSVNGGVTMKRMYFYPAVFQIEEQGYSVFIPDIPGCMTQGETMEEALAMAQEAIGLMLEEVAPADYPVPSLPQDLPLEKDQFTLMVPFDKLAYDKAYSAKSVKKTLSVPQCLDTLATERNVDFSNILQNALMRELGVSKA